MRNSKLWAPAFSQFEALRLHVPDEIDDRRIREYHDLLNQLQIASGEDLICFQIPQNEIHPKILSVTRVSRRFPSRTQFSKTKYCSKDFFSRLRLLSTILAVVVLTAAAAAQKLVSFPTEDGGVVYADVYGQGERGVVLAHGGPFNKESWAKLDGLHLESLPWIHSCRASLPRSARSG